MDLNSNRATLLSDKIQVTAQASFKSKLDYAYKQLKNKEVNLNYTLKLFE